MKEDNEELILELGIKHLKRREEQAKKKKKKKKNQQLARNKAERSKVRLNCRTKKDEDKDNDEEAEDDDKDNYRVKSVTWRALGMEPFQEVPREWRDNMVWPPG